LHMYPTLIFVAIFFALAIGLFFLFFGKKVGKEPSLKIPFDIYQLFSVW
jgi:hypothetical protein